MYVLHAHLLRIRAHACMMMLLCVFRFTTSLYLKGLSLICIGLGGADAMDNGGLCGILFIFGGFWEYGGLLKEKNATGAQLWCRCGQTGPARWGRAGQGPPERPKNAPLTKVLAKNQQSSASDIRSAALGQMWANRPSQAGNVDVSIGCVFFLRLRLMQVFNPPHEVPTEQRPVLHERLHPRWLLR